MTARRRVGWSLAIVAAAAVAALIVVFGVIGFPATVTAGTQTPVCGVRIAVREANETAKIAWGDDQQATLTVGDHARVAPWCVLELTGIRAASPGDDGGGSIGVTWRLW